MAFNCGSEVKFHGFRGSYIFNYFNHNAKVLSIGKIGTEIKNGEDVTRPNTSNPVAASQLVLHGQAL